MNWTLVSLCLILSHSCGAANITDIENLYTDLILNATNPELLRNVRPSDKTKVKGSLHLLSISGLDEISGTFSTIVTIKLKWRDQRLRWTPSAYGNLKDIVVPQDKIWTPSINIRYPIKKVKKLGPEENLAKISRNGSVVLNLGDFIETVCQFDVTHFPFDRQSCDIILFLLSYTKDEVDFKQRRGDVDLSAYSSNGMWKISGTKVSVVYILTSDNNKCAALKYTIELERRSSYFVLTIFVPVIMLLLLNSAVFILPTESGERVGYAITCLLALVVFLTLTVDVLPRTSDPLSVLSSFLMLLVLTSAGICLATIISVWLHHKDEKSPMPLHLKKFTYFMLCRCRKVQISDCTSEIVEASESSENFTTKLEKNNLKRNGQPVANSKVQRVTSQDENVTLRESKSKDKLDSKNEIKHRVKKTSSNDTIHVELKNVKMYNHEILEIPLKSGILDDLYADITWKTFSELFNFLCLVGTLTMTAVFGFLYVLIAGGNL